jgi:hypothetical protein
VQLCIIDSSATSLSRHGTTATATGADIPEDQGAGSPMHSLHDSHPPHPHWDGRCSTHQGYPANKQQLQHKLSRADQDLPGQGRCCTPDMKYKQRAHDHGQSWHPVVAQLPAGPLATTAPSPQVATANAHK